MKFNARGGVSILELVIFFPSLIVATIVCKRHGFGRSSGWIFTLILCLIRIIGACCQLATYIDQSSGLLQTTIVIDSVGLSPLLLATLGLLSRCVDSIQERANTALGAIHFRLLQIMITVGLILSIVGGTSSTTSTEQYKPQTSSKIGIILYIVAYVALTLTGLFTLSRISNAEAREKKIVIAVLIALPFIAVRLAYSLIAVLGHSSKFNLITGSVAILVVMGVLMEAAVVTIYLVTGWKTEAKSTSGAIASRPWKGNLSTPASQQTRPSRGFSQGRQPRGPIHGLVGMAMAAATHHDHRDMERGQAR